MSKTFAGVYATLSLFAILSLSGCASKHPEWKDRDVRNPLDSPVSSLAFQKRYRTARVSSEEREGNRDFRRLEPRESLVLADLQGPGEITHLWMTIASDDPNHLRDLVLRIYYNGNPFPSVESPVGDFFGLGNCKVYTFNNLVQAIGTDKGLNCFWPMPFEKSARVEVTNESAIPTGALYFYVDWRKVDKLPREVAYFHAQYRQAFPCVSKQPYTILETEGCPGHYVGCNLSVHTQVSGWWGEGDDLFAIDGESAPSLWGTGSEDYFCGAWCYGKTFYNDYFGMPYRERMDQKADNFWNVYRLHVENPVPFTRSIKVQIEHGASGFDNTRAGGQNNDYSSVAYWYMKKPIRLIGDLPPAQDRIPSFRPLTPPPNVLEPQDFDITTTPTEGVGLQFQDMTWFADHRLGKWLFNQQLFCIPNVDGAVFRGEFNTDKDLEGPLKFFLTQAPDYGRIRIRLDDTVVVPSFNGVHERVRSVLVEAGDFRLPKGEHALTIETIEKDEESKGFLWGFDCFRVGGDPLDFEDTVPVVPGDSGN